MYQMILTIKEAVCKILTVILLLPTGYCLSDSNDTVTVANPFESIENPYIVEYLNPDIAADLSVGVFCRFLIPAHLKVLVIY